MSNFMASLFSGSPSKNSDASLPAAPPPLHTRSSQNDAYGDRPSTPSRNNFITPISTPMGSPSKNKNPPGAIDLPHVFENAMKLNAPTAYGSPPKLDRGAATLDYNQRSAQDTGDSSANGSPLRRQGNENTPPITRTGIELGQANNLAALSRQDGYLPRENSTPTIRKYNTQRGLTQEELELLQKPNVKRLANVTQLCKSSGNSCW